MRGTGLFVAVTAVLLAAAGPACAGDPAPVSTRTPAAASDARTATLDLVRRVARAGDPSSGGTRPAMLKAVEAAAPQADMETLAFIVSDPDPPASDVSLKPAAIELIRADKTRAGPFVAKALKAPRRPGAPPTPELVRIAGEVGGSGVESAALEQMSVRGTDPAPWLRILGAAGSGRCLPAVYDLLLAAKEPAAAAGPVGCAGSVIQRLTDAEKRSAVDSLWARVDAFRLPGASALNGVFTLSANAATGPVDKIGQALTQVGRRSSDDDQEKVRLLECSKAGWRALASIGTKEATDELLRRFDDEKTGDPTHRVAILSAMVALGGKHRSDKVLMQAIVERMGSSDSDRERDAFAQVLFALAGEVVNYNRDVDAWRRYVGSLPSKK